MAMIDSLVIDTHIPRGKSVIDDPFVLEHRVWQYRLIVPVLYVLGAYVQLKKAVCALLGLRSFTNSIFVDGMSMNSRRVKDGAARWPALDATYNYRRPEGRTRFHRLIDHYWMQIRNAQAVRNRLKIAKSELRSAIAAIAEHQRAVNIVSLAAGSAQGVIEAVEEMRTRGITCRVLLIDQDRSALAYARKLAYAHGIEDVVEVREGDVISFKRFLDFKPHIIEMMGLVDYLRDATAIGLFQRIRRELQPGGYLFTCHIHPNNEAYFLRHVVDWDMLYRTSETLEDLVVRGGFLEQRILTEPHGIHSIAIGRKF